MGKKAVAELFNRKEFQKKLSNLKKATLVPSTLDIRKVKPTKHYKSLISKYADVATGKAIATEFKNKDLISLFSDRGDKVVTKGNRNFLLTGTEFTKKAPSVSISDDGTVTRKYVMKTIDGKRKVSIQKELPVPFTDTEKYIEKLQNDPAYKLKDGEKLFFKFHGHYSRRSFNSIDDAMKYFTEYEVFKSDDLSAEQLYEVMRSIGIEKISGSEAKSYNRDRIVDPNKQFNPKKKRNKRKERGVSNSKQKSKK